MPPLFRDDAPVKRTGLLHRGRITAIVAAVAVLAVAATYIGSLVLDDTRGGSMPGSHASGSRLAPDEVQEAAMSSEDPRAESESLERGGAKSAAMQAISDVNEAPIKVPSDVNEAPIEPATDVKEALARLADAVVFTVTTVAAVGGAPDPGDPIAATGSMSGSTSSRRVAEDQVVEEGAKSDASSFPEETVPSSKKPSPEASPSEEPTPEASPSQEPTPEESPSQEPTPEESPSEEPSPSPSGSP